MAVGWKKVKDNWYYFKKSGIITYGWQNIDEKRYYFDTDGKMAVGWMEIDGDWYYFKSSGAMKSGWLTLNGKKYYLNTDKVSRTSKGIDVSTFQDEIDWQKVKDDGYEFAMIRGGYGKKKDQKDEQFENNYKNAKAVGMPIGVYHYSYATSVKDAEKEAKFCLSYLKGKKFEYPIAFDIEDKTQEKLSKEMLTAIIKTFCKKLTDAGYYVVIYASKSWLTNNFIMDELTDYDVWVAQYYTEVTYEGDYTMWQYTSKGSVDGIEGNVDLDYSYKNYEYIIPSSELNGFTKEDAENVKATISSGQRLTGWQIISDKWYYFGKDGAAYTGMKTIKKKLYYFNNNGVMQTGWKKLDGKWYYFSTTGAAKTGMDDINEKYYYFNKNGVMQTGWKKINGYWYYFKQSGAMKTGWSKENGNWYYLGTNGRMFTGKHTIKGKVYKFKSSGICKNPY